MATRKWLKWIVGVIVATLGALVVLRSIPFHKLETTLVFENRSGQRLRNIKVAHNGEIVFEHRLLEAREGIALSGLDPFKGPNARPRRGDVYQAEARGTIAFVRDADGREERHDFNAGGHSDHFQEKCLFVFVITPKLLDSGQCIPVKPAKRQADPQN